MAGGTWTAALTDRLAELKRSGQSFDRAWAVAIIEHPPRYRELGVTDDGTLMAEAAKLEAVRWYQERCRDAWEGRQPALRSLGGVIDRTAFASPVGSQHRQREVRSLRIA